jgi:hypothetical protein
VGQVRTTLAGRAVGGCVRGLFVAAVVVVNNVFRFLVAGDGWKMDDKRSGIGASRLCLVCGEES